MAGPNLEVFKFGVYIAFPIAWMWYFGTNLDARFNIPDFWPTQEQSHKIPTEREEQAELMTLLRERREKGVRERLEMEKARQRGLAGESGEVNYERRIGDGMGRRMGEER